MWAEGSFVSFTSRTSKATIADLRAEVMRTFDMDVPWLARPRNNLWADAFLRVRIGGIILSKWFASLVVTHLPWL